MSTAAELIVKCLENEGVEVVFGVPGEENIRFTNALARSEKIRYVLTRHEQAASFMAEMYGRLTGSAGVMSATLGPGRDQPDARRRRRHDEQHARRRDQRAGRQGAQLQGVPPVRGPGVHVRPGHKWSADVPATQAIPEMVRRAFKTAESERPGAVYLAVPEDVDEATDGSDLRPLRRNVVQPEAPSPRRSSGRRSCCARPAGR